MRFKCSLLASLIFIAALLAGCQSATLQAQPGIKVLAVETFLADIAQNVAGDRLKVEALVPLGLDPHAFEPTPRDVVRLAEANLIIANGAGFEEWLVKVIQNAGSQALMVEAASGLQARTPTAGEALDADHVAGDPHFWLDPLSVVRYSENIRDGLTRLDPDGKDAYARNTAAYISRLKELDGWIRQQVETVPAARRLMVTNHESLGYFADRYGFKIIGTVIPSVSTGASPSARQMAGLVDAIRQSGAPAIFLETGANPGLAEQLARETSVKVVGDLYTHSVTDPRGPAPTYLDMMKANVNAIVDALK